MQSGRHFENPGTANATHASRILIDIQSNLRCLDPFTHVFDRKMAKKEDLHIA